MNASHFLQLPENHPLVESASRFSWVKSIPAFGHSVVLSSNWLKSGSVARDAFNEEDPPKELLAAVEKRFASQDPHAPYSKTMDQWRHVAADVGLPEFVPKSVWGIEFVENERASLLSTTVWDETMWENASKIVATHSISRPGTVTPPLFCGPTGASKTHVVRSTYAALGVPVRIIDGTNSLSQEINVKYFDGGTIAMPSNLGAYVESLGKYGYFRTAKGRLHYYQAVAKESNACGEDLVRSHKRLSPETFFEIAQSDGYSNSSSSLFVEFPGMIRLIERAGGVTLLDEVNKFPVEKLQDLRKFFSFEGAEGDTNTMFCMTQNPPTAEYARSSLPADFVGTTLLIPVEARSAIEYSDLLNMADGAERTVNPATHEVAGLIAAINPRSPSLALPNAADVLSMRKDFTAALDKPSAATMTLCLYPEGVKECNARLGKLQRIMEEEAAPGRKLDPAAYGAQRDASKPSIRSLFAIRSLWSSSCYSAGLMACQVDGNLNPSHAEALRAVSPDVMAESLAKAVNFFYHDPYLLTADSATTGIVSPADDDDNQLNAQTNHSFLVGAIKSSGLDENGLKNLFREHHVPPNSASRAFTHLAQSLTESSAKASREQCHELAGRLEKLITEDAKASGVGFDHSAPIVLVDGHVVQTQTKPLEVTELKSSPPLKIAGGSDAAERISQGYFASQNNESKKALFFRVRVGDSKDIQVACATLNPVFRTENTSLMAEDKFYEEYSKSMKLDGCGIVPGAFATDHHKYDCDSLVEARLHELSADAAQAVDTLKKSLSGKPKSSSRREPKYVMDDDDIPLEPASPRSKSIPPLPLEA